MPDDVDGFFIREQNEKTRARNLLKLGGLLILAFLLPLLLPDQTGRPHLMLPNIQWLSLPVPGILKFYLLWPGIAGVVLAVLAVVTMGLTRAGLVILIGLFPQLLAVMIDPASVTQQLAEAGSAGWLLLLLQTGLIFLFTGSRARTHEPSSKPAALVGAVGAVLFFLALLVPVVPVVGPNLIAIPFRLMAQEGIRTLGFGILLSVLGVGASAVLSLMNVKDREDAHRLAAIASHLFIASVAALLLFILFEVFGGLRHAPITLYFAAVLLILKVLTSVVGIFLVVPLGGVELIVDLSQRFQSLSWRALEKPPTVPETFARHKAPQDQIRDLQRELRAGRITETQYEAKKQQIMQARKGHVEPPEEVKEQMLELKRLKFQHLIDDVDFETQMKKLEAKLPPEPPPAAPGPEGSPPTQDL